MSKGNTSEIWSYYSLIVSRFFSCIEWFNKGLLLMRSFFRQPRVSWESKPIFICLWEHMLSKIIRSQYFIIFLPCNQCSNDVRCIKNTSFPRTLASFTNCVKSLDIALIIQYANIHSRTCWLNTTFNKPFFIVGQKPIIKSWIQFLPTRFQKGKIYIEIIFVNFILVQ